MSSEELLSDHRVILKSIELIKSIITKLDTDQGGLDGLQTVLDQFSPNDIIDKPEGVLDGLILYLYFVHGIDWYSDSWSVKTEGILTTRHDSRVFPGKREQEIHAYLQRLRARTQLFLQVLFCTVHATDTSSFAVLLTVLKLENITKFKQDELEVEDVRGASIGQVPFPER